jgi:hypothetical protein
VLYATKLGPVDTEEGRINAYLGLMPREPFLPPALPVFHRRDLDGLRAVVACAPRHRVVCTPSLGRAARRLGCEVAELPRRWLPFVAGLGLGFAGGGFTCEVADTDVLGAFARASAEFMRAEPWRLSSRSLRIRATVTGATTERTYVGSIFGARHAPPFLMLYEHENALELLEMLQSVAALDGIGMMPEFKVPRFTAPLLRRAFGLDFLPLPFKVAGGRMGSISTAETIALAAVLRAAAALKPRARLAASVVPVDNAVVAARVELLMVGV